MICPKCGNECGKNTYCPKCGTRLVRTCKNCHRVLNNEDRFCPDCGTDNLEVEKTSKNTVGLIGFLMVLLFSIFSVLKMTPFRGSFRIWTNAVLYYLPYTSIFAVFAVFYLVLIIFSIIGRASGSKACCIITLVLAVFLCVVEFWRLDSFIILAGSIMLLCDRKEKVKKTEEKN